MATRKLHRNARRFSRNVRAFVSASIVLAAPTAFAGPDATTNYLMNTPATLLDFGLYKLSLRIQAVNGNGYAAYDWDNDEIKIVLFRSLEPKTKSKVACVKAIADTRQAAGVVDGKSLEEFSSFARMFGHNGFIAGDLDAHNKRMQDLDKKFQILCITPQATYEAAVVGSGYSLRVNE
ncbi:hypothetical protein ACGYK4_08145 [Sulfitobacter sp. 1A13368]